MSSSELFKTLKGMQDILPPDIYLWQTVEAAARELFSSYGFREMRPPVVESTALFSRSIGESTDIVEKEMYTFTDKAGRSITLRPEGTASVVRSYVENHLYNEPAPQKYYYSGPMFRYERPQSGRFRQFYQIGVEAFGSAHPSMDAEVLSMLRHFFAKIGFSGLTVQINSIGCEQCRPAYKGSLLRFFSGMRDDLCPDCQRRFNLNPLRILDCKVSRCMELRQGSPRVSDSLCRDCREHFDLLRSLLAVLDVPAVENPDMVRGLDYYTRSTFEITSEQLGAQNALAAGGRYDRLVGEFGGPETPAVGFAVGMERIISLLRKNGNLKIPSPQVFIAVVGENAERECLMIADTLRVRGVWTELGDRNTSLKSQMRRANKLSAAYVLVIGDEEISTGRIRWKRLSDSSEGDLSFAELPEFLLAHTAQ